MKRSLKYAVFLLLTVLIFSGCGALGAPEDEIEYQRSVITAAEASTTAAEISTEAPTEAESEAFEETSTAFTETMAETQTEPLAEQLELHFRSKKLLTSHYEKHGIEMGFSSAEEYEAAACAVVNNADALHKLEKEDSDDVYYLEETNEFVIVSTDGYLRTYFKPDRGKAYYDKQ